MANNEQIIRNIENFYDVETLRLQIDYCKSVVEAARDDLRNRNRPADEAAKAPKPVSLTAANQCNAALSMLTEARRLQSLLIKDATNLALGEKSPYINDAYLLLHEQNPYEEYCRLRLMIKPRAARRPRPTAPDRLPRERASAPRERVPAPRANQAKPEAPAVPPADLDEAISQWERALDRWEKDNNPNELPPRIRPDVEAFVRQAYGMKPARHHPQAGGAANAGGAGDDAEKPHVMLITHDYKRVAGGPNPQTEA